MPSDIKDLAVKLVVKIIIPLIGRGLKGIFPGNKEEGPTPPTEKPNDKETLKNPTTLNPSIAVDQVGYLPESKKEAFVAGGKFLNGQGFFVVDTNNNRICFKGDLGEGKPDKHTKKIVRTADFSGLITAGKYSVVIGNLRSYPFEISNSVYKKLCFDSLKAFYTWKCGADLKPEIAGDFAHSSDHAQDKKAPVLGEPGKRMDVSGGLHESGIYNKFVINGALTVGLVLLGFELYPEIFNGIEAESVEGLKPLALMRYELEWLMKMQEEDGSVHHKVSPYVRNTHILPQDDKKIRYVSAVSSNATADVAAVLAQASIIYRELDPAFADKCLKRSYLAWNWLEEHPKPKPFRDTRNDSSGGSYPDSYDADERFWASVELFRATGDVKYQDHINRSLHQMKKRGYLPGWKQVEALGFFSYLLDKGGNDRLKKELRDDIVRFSDNVLSLSGNSGYRIPLRYFDWGSNRNALMYALTLMVAYRTTGQAKYRQGAEDILHYVLGRNPLSKCYVTGFGSDPPTNAHYLPSMVLKKPLPGLLVGGPNQSKAGADTILLTKLLTCRPIECYSDQIRLGYITSYATNEPCIDYNAILFVVSGALNYFGKAQK
jgi:endoglucanase